MTRFQKLIDAWVRGERNPAPIAELVGFRLASFTDGVARVEMEAGSRHHNPMGFVHGGVLCDMADAAMGVAMAATLEDGESFATLQLSASYLRPVREGKLVVNGWVVHRGRANGHVEAEMADGEGRLVARFTSTCAVTRNHG
ncbi:MAG TPA: PaaI family thioesterase [Thermoanaerobaculia bacterium]